MAKYYQWYILEEVSKNFRDVNFETPKQDVLVFECVFITKELSFNVCANTRDKMLRKQAG